MERRLVEQEEHRLIVIEEHILVKFEECNEHVIDINEQLIDDEQLVGRNLRECYDYHDYDKRFWNFLELMVFFEHNLLQSYYNYHDYDRQSSNFFELMVRLCSLLQNYVEYYYIKMVGHKLLKLEVELVMLTFLNCIANLKYLIMEPI
jgi:hypothetical protein